MTASRYPARHYLMAGASIALLSACGHGGTTTSQVAVRVNKDEISVHQINERLARVNSTGMTDDQKVTAQKTVLEGLVDQDLLLEQAKARQLDRDPDVVSAMENSRRQILVDAYVQKQILPSAKPSDEEIKKYYNDNPGLFAERRIYALQEAVLTGLTDEQLVQLRQKLVESKNDPKSFDETIRWLKTHDNVKIAANMGVRPAEQLPMRLLASLSKLKDGGVGLFDGPKNSVNLVKIVSSQLSPVDEKSARASIEQFLTNRKRDELLVAEVKRLRDAAKIEYVGDFQKLALQGDANAPATKAAASPSAEGQGAVSTAKAAADPIAKGIKGL
jgi:EpsD family peptidyl-prolyl cis-trans isomerase